MWTTATLGKFTNNSTWTMWNIFVGTCKDYFSLVEASSKVFKNRRESRWNATLNEPVPRLIWRFVWDLTQKSSFVPNKRPESISLLSQSSYTKKFTRKLDCSPYMFGSCKEFSSAKMEPTNLRAFSRTTFKEHRGKTSTHAPGWAFPVTFSVTLSNQSLPRARLHSVYSLWCSCSVLYYSCFWLFCSYWICFYG